MVKVRGPVSSEDGVGLRVAAAAPPAVPPSMFASTDFLDVRDTLQTEGRYVCATQSHLACYAQRHGLLGRAGE